MATVEHRFTARTANYYGERDSIYATLTTDGVWVLSNRHGEACNWLVRDRTSIDSIRTSLKLLGYE